MLQSQRADLLEILNDQRPASDREAAILAVAKDVLLRANPFDRDDFRGHFTASVIVLDPKMESILLLKHQIFDKWVQPGGHVESTDRDPLGGALRELSEEAGVTEVEVLLDGEPIDIAGHLMPQSHHGRSHVHLDICYLVKASDSQIPQSPEGLETRWMELTEVPTLGDLPFSRTIKKVVRAIRGLDLD